MKVRVLVIDDEPSISRSLTRILTDKGYEVSCAETAADGLARAEEIRPHFVLLDVRLPDGSGLDLIPRLHQIEAETQIVVVTAVGDTSSVVRAVKLGAIEYLRKPYDMEELLLILEKAARSGADRTTLSGFREKDRSHYSRNELRFRGPEMTAVWELIQKLAKSDATSVLITGESGTGKELVARAIHFESERREAPFMEINCANFQENLLENELFGHERGAFTGASRLKRGLAELADGGTLFLDEVGEMPFGTQAKLLRFLESRSFRRVGGGHDIGIDIRVVAATNVDLEDRIERGLFRKDLFYRLQVISVQLPPLRDRREDIDLLAEHFLGRYSSELKKGFEAIDAQALTCLRNYAWPGNVRELQNLIERIVIIEDEATLTPAHLPDAMRRDCEVSRSRSKDPEDTALVPASSSEVRDREAGARYASKSLSENQTRPTLREIEDAYIAEVLEECEGNKSQTARVLGLSRQGLIDRIKRMGSTKSPARRS